MQQMIPLYDCLGRLACMGNPKTGQLECRYKGHKTIVILALGETFTIERQGVVTIVTRNSINNFKVETSQKKEL